MIYKTALAQQYYPTLSPHQALRQLVRLIKQVPPCASELSQLGLFIQPRRRYFTAKEAEIIQKHLGPPGENTPNKDQYGPFQTI